MNHKFEARYSDTYLRPLKKDDIENLRMWRNDKESSHYLRKLGYITPEMQLRWYESYIKDSSEIIFAIVETSDLHRMVGSLAIYEINNEAHTAEIGKIQIGDKEAHGRGIGRKALVMAMKAGFQKLGIKKFVGAVHQENIPARTNDKKIGFRFVGEQTFAAGGKEDLLEAVEEDISKANSYYPDITLSEEE